jgi:hypothetical protein
LTAAADVCNSLTAEDFMKARLAMSAEVLQSSDEPDVVRFRDNNGIVVEVKARD